MSTSKATQQFTVLNVLVSHTMEVLTPERVNEIVNELTTEMQEGPCAWAFGNKPLSVPLPLDKESVRARMQNVAKAVVAQLPEGYGFFVLCFPFNAPPESPGEYVSNARWQDVRDCMEKLLQRRGMPDPGLN